MAATGETINITDAYQDERFDPEVIHSVWIEWDVRRIEFVVIFFQWTQNWTALNFEVNFQPLIQLNSRGLQNRS